MIARHLVGLPSTERVRDWLAASSDVRILHVFDSTCNLLSGQGEILSIVPRRIGDGPFNLLVTPEIIFRDHLRAESPVSLRAGQLRLGELTVDVAHAALWSPRPDWETLHAKRDAVLAHLMSSSIANYQPLLPDSLISDLTIAIAAADISSSLTTTRRLAGLGNGLTPAGDDFILGTVLAAWIIHPAEVARVLAEEITNTAAPLTTSLSAAWLRAAGRGEAGELWHAFFKALVSADSMAIENWMNKILAVGATSGADALAGFRAAFLSWAELASPRIP